MKVIAIANQKGGVGKTTTATCLASILSSWGYKTLLIDTDVQCNSTDTYRAKVEGVATTYDLVIEEPPCSIDEAIQHTEYGDIIAGDPGLEKADLKLQDEDAFFKLKDALENLTGYEYIIIDTNPDVNVMLRNALVASDEVVIPVTTDRYPLKGLSQLTGTISRVQKRLNPQLKIAGLLIVKYHGNTNLGKDVKNTLVSAAEEIGTKVFDTNIRESIKCRESQALRMPLIHYAKKATTEIDYENFVREFLGVSKRPIKKAKSRRDSNGKK